ncbi:MULTISPECIES: PKD domain-containing protein [Halorussus]|uniref:PKD domain-containing protein n=1 Tax=Halorussus TaxID=1070314 RepID=UPI00209ECD0C|nr:PKD domain-containing protein [Halorussus vallis]USZ76533.1 PKD domain-containing protein [Halorussus vallis]
MREAMLSVALLVMVVAAPLSGTVAAAGATTTTPVAASDTANTAAQNAPELPERWNRTVGGSGDDKFTDAVAVDGGYLVVGWSNSTDGAEAHDGYVAMVDRTGRTSWERTYGGPGVDRVFDVVKVDDGYLLAGLSADSGEAWDGWVLKIDEKGAVQWERTYGESGPDAVWSLAQSGDAIFTAGYQKRDTAEAWVMELDAKGRQVWSEEYDTLRSGTDEYVNSIFATDGGKLLLTGTIEGGSGTDPADAWVMELSRSGEVEWQKDYGGAKLDKVHDAAAGANGGFLLAGRSASEGDQGQDGWLLKVNADGEREWSRTYGTARDDAFYGVTRDADGGYVFTGAMNKLSQNGADGWILRTDADGKKQWSRTFGNKAWDKFWPAVEGHGGGYLAVGDTTSFGENRDGWLVRLGGPAVAAIEDAAPNASGSTVMLSGSPVRSVTLANANASGVLAVSEQTNLSALSPPGEALYAVTVTGPESATGTAAVEFAVPTDGVAELSDVKVAHRTDGGWKFLKTTVVSESNGTAILSAKARGTGTLAVTSVDAPSASIDANESVLVGESLELSADGSNAENGTIESYRWTVAGETYTGASATVSFDELGEHAVNLTVTDAVGLNDSATASVVVNDKPSVSLDGPSTVEVGKAATFSADVSDTVGDTTVTWKFGDGEVTGESVEHSFATAGTKTVTVVVADEHGATVTKELSVKVGQQDGQNGTSGGSDGGEGSIPGFTPATAVVALLAAALVARRTA